MKNLLGLLLVVLMTGTVFAQPETAEVEWKSGRKYYVHFVQTGNTLYGLTKLYKVTAEEILAENPELSSGLKEGQKVLIPAVAAKNEEKKTSTATDAIAFQRTHTVEKSETLYGISKKYEVTIDDMVKANPGIENGINVGQVLNVPAKSTVKPVVKTEVKTQPKVIFYDTTILHTVLDHETVYSISKRFMVAAEELQEFNGIKNQKIKSGDVLKIPLKKEKITKVEIREVVKVDDKKVDEELIFKSKNYYNVLMILPFNLDKSKDGFTGISTEFLMGAQIALDSLKDLGLNAKIIVIDGADSMKLKAMFSKSEFKTADLVIGPFMGANLEMIARWCKSNKVRLISPIIGQTDVLKDNPYVFNAMTSDITLVKGMAQYISKNHPTDQIILVKTGAKDEELYQAFRQKFMQLSANGSKQKLIEINQAEMGTYIRKGVNTVFVVPTRDKVTALKFMNALHAVANKAGSGTISVFGTKEWVNFDDIKVYYKNKYNFHYAAANDFNYTYPETKNLLAKYRKQYNADLSKFATQGFDVTYYFIYSMLMEGKPKPGVMNNISMVPTGNGNGHENNSCFIIKQQDYEFVKMALVNE